MEEKEDIFPSVNIVKKDLKNFNIIINYKENAIKNSLICGIFLIIVLNLINLGIIDIFSVENTIFSFFLTNGIIILVVVMYWIYQTKFNLEFKFDKINNIFIIERKNFRNFKKRNFNISEIDKIECSWNTIAGAYLYTLNLRLKNHKKIKIFETTSKSKVLNYTNELKDFLGVSCDYPIVGSKKNWL